ncbi:LysM peptidoglycan-binding domain-containing protein, partial [Streptococcus sp. k-432]
TVEEVKDDLQKEGDLFKYVIKWGDTLSVISEASNIPVDVLQEMNQASGKNLFLPHNELYFTEAETVSDTVTKHKIVIKESGASGEVRTYEVLLKKDQETKDVTFELTDVTEKVEKMTVNYSSVYQPVSAPVAPKAEHAATTPAPKAEEPTASAPKDDESASSVESPSTSNHSEESGAPSTTPTGDSTATQPSDSTSSPVTPSEEAPVTSGDTNSTTQPAGETGKSETTSESSNTPSADATNESGNSESSSSVTDDTSSNTGTADQPETSAPKTEATAPKPSDSTSSPVTPSEETPVASGDTNSTAQPAGETGNSETTAEPSNTPSAEATNESGNAAESSPVTDNAPSNTGTTEQPVASNPSSEEPVAPAPKNDESGSSVESPTTSNHSEESGAPSTTPTGDSTATQPSDSTSSPVTSGDTNSTTQPAGATGNSETTAEPSNTPSAEATNESGNAAESSSVTDNAPSNTGAADQPVASNSSSESPATSAPKAEESATTEPKAEELTSEEAKAKKELADAQKDGEDIINERVSSKLGEIEKVKDEAEKEKLKAELKTLKEDALAAINNAKDHDAAVAAADEYQTKIDEINVPGEELPAPNYNKDNLTNGRNEGTTIDNGSTVIGHGSGEATSTTPTQPASEESTTSTASPTQPSSTSEGASSFRNAPSVQARARRVARSTSEPDGTVNISYNFAGMPDIHGFLSDPGENNTVTIPAGTSEAQAKELVKEKIQAKIKDLAARGYYVKNDIIFEQDTTVKNYNYVVTFTKEATGTSGFRMAPAVQPRASRNRRSIEQPVPQKVKVNVFYNFDQMKDIAGFLGDINGTSLEIAEGLSNEQVKAAVKSQVDAKKEELSKRGYTFKEDYVYQANGKDYNYVVTFSKATK